MADKEATLIIRIKEAGQSALDGIGKGLASLPALAMAALSAIAGFATLALKNFREQEEATNKLNQAMANSGVYSKSLADDYNKLASEMQKTTQYGDESTLSAIATIQTYVKGTAVTKDLVKATADLAAAKGIDLVQAAEMVGKSIGTSTNALARQGIQVNENASQSEKLAQVTQKLNGLFGGQAEASASGLGAIQKMNNAFSDFMEDVGKEIAPTVITMANVFTQLFNRISQGSGIVEGFGAIFDWVAKGVLIAKAHISLLGAEIGIGLAGAIEAGKAAMSLKFGQALDITKSAISEIKQAHVDTEKQLNSELAAIDEARTQQKLENKAKELALLAQSKVTAKQIEVDQQTKDDMEAMTFRQQQFDLEMQQVGLNQQQMLQSQYDYLGKRISAEKDAYAKQGLMQAQAALQDKLLEEKKAETKKQIMQDSLSTIASLQSSGNKTLAAIGKAAAITNIMISAPIGIARALELGPFLGPPAAALMATAFAAQAANIAGVQLAEGGIVKATPGGIQATIGEGGRDEAVIPLGDDRAASRLGGTTVNIVVNGGMLGDPSSAREFAVAVDRELLRLRQNNESAAFDSGVV
jgi:hypothetical protein